MKNTFAVLLLLASSCLAQDQTQRPPIESTLRTQVGEYHVFARNLLEAAAKISSEFNFPIGIAWKDSFDTTKIVAGNWKNATVGDLLRAIVAQDRQYELDISDGVAHIRPTGFSRNAKNFLNIKLPEFVANNDYTQQIGFTLKDQLHEIIVSGHPPVHPAACAGTAGIGAEEVKTSLNLHNPTVEQVLDALLVSSRYSMWIVIYEPANLFHEYIRTTSALRTPLEQDQPTWDFMARYYDPVEQKQRGDWRPSKVAAK